MEKDVQNKYVRMLVDVIVFGVGMVLAKIIQFFLMPIYTSYMSAESYGQAELVNNLSDLFFPIVTLCVYKASFRYAVNSQFTQGEVIKSSLRILFSSSLIGLMIVFFIDAIWKYEYAWYLYIILYTYSLKMLLSYYVRGKGYSKVFAISGIVNALALVAFTAYFVIYANRGETGYLLSICLGYIVTVVYLFVAGKIYKDVRNTKVNISCEKSQVSFGLPLIFYNIGYWFTTMSGRYVLLLFTDSKQVGLYVAAIKISAVINMMQQAIQLAFELNASKEYANSDKEKYYSKLCNIFSSIFFIVGAIVIAVSSILSAITLKKEFIYAQVYLPIILLASIVQCLSALYGTMYIVYKRTKESVPNSVLGTIINLGFSILLTPKIGIWGVCIASLLCYLSQLIYKLHDIKKFCALRIQYKAIIISFLLLLVEMFCMTLEKKYCTLVICSVVIVINIMSNYTDLKNIFKRMLIRLSAEK